MKSRMHNHLKVLNYMTSSDLFKAIFIMTIILSFYGSMILGVSSDNYIDSVFIPFQFPIFNIFLFSLLFLNTLNTSSIFNKNFSNYIIRLGNKKRYLNELILITVIVDLFFLLLFFILFFSLLNIFKLGNIEIHLYQNYNVTNLVYLVFYLIRYVIYGILIMVISVFVYMNFKSKVSILVDAIFLGGFLFVSFLEVNEISFTILPWYYYNGVLYSSFSLELFYSFLFLILLIVVTCIGYSFTIRNKKLVIT